MLKQEIFMKKKALSFFLALVMVAMFLVPINSSASSGASVGVQDAQGYVSQLVDVKVVMSDNLQAAVGKLVINYDRRLELVSFTNGTVFEETSSEITGEENGTFTYVGFIDISESNTNSSASSGDVIITLKFRIPDNATISDNYEISVVDSASEFTESVGSGSSASGVVLPVSSYSGKITVLQPANCSAEHTFGEKVVVREASYFAGAYSYRTCSACGYVESSSSTPVSTNVFTPVGTAIRYAGNPSGIGAHFKVNAESIKAIENKGYQVQIGMELVYGEKINKEIFYGYGTPIENQENFNDGVISACIEGIGPQQKGTICAYVEIIDSTGVSRIERTYITVSGSKDISIADVASLLNFNKYSPASRDYLNAVVTGFGY